MFINYVEIYIYKWSGSNKMSYNFFKMKRALTQHRLKCGTTTSTENVAATSSSLYLSLASAHLWQRATSSFTVASLLSITPLNGSVFEAFSNLKEGTLLISSANTWFVNLKHNVKFVIIEKILKAKVYCLWKRLKWPLSDP